MIHAHIHTQKKSQQVETEADIANQQLCNVHHDKL